MRLVLVRLFFSGLDLLLSFFHTSKDIISLVFLHDLTITKDFFHLVFGTRSSLFFLDDNGQISTINKIINTFLDDFMNDLLACTNGRIRNDMIKLSFYLLINIRLEEVFGNCEVVKKDKGYYILRSVKE